jgi:hypothetical protein
LAAIPEALSTAKAEEKPVHVRPPEVMRQVVPDRVGNGLRESTFTRQPPEIDLELGKGV